MQKLLVKLKNTPMDASQVRSSVNLPLNKDENLSEVDIVLANNNLDVNRLWYVGGFDLRVQTGIHITGIGGNTSIPVPLYIKNDNSSPA